MILFYFIFYRKYTDYKAAEESAAISDLYYFSTIGCELKWAGLRNETPGLKISPTAAIGLAVNKSDTVFKQNHQNNPDSKI